MNLFYDERDDEVHRRHGSRILNWLDELGAKPISEATAADRGFLFAGSRPISDYRQLVERLPSIGDRPEQRHPLLQLDTVLDALDEVEADVPTPRTWRLPLDAALPNDLTFPLFLRTATSSLKLGGRASRVTNVKQLITEATELRRLLGWNALILARAWCDFVVAGNSVYGPVPQEVRVWIVDQQPVAWSFHYLNVVSTPQGFPPAAAELENLFDLSKRVGAAFQSRCVAADFAKTRDGQWVFIEAGPGSCAGTAHEEVFKAVAARLIGKETPVAASTVGGLL